MIPAPANAARRVRLHWIELSEDDFSNVGRRMKLASSRPEGARGSFELCVLTAAR
jgi:hypothetical protein